MKDGPAKGLRMEVGNMTESYLRGDYERPVQEALAVMLKEGDVFFDVGANIGFFANLAARFIEPAGAVYAFEPVPENAQMIYRNAKLNHFDNIWIFTIALSSATGAEELLLARYAGGAVLKSAGVPPDRSGSLMVETSTLDDFLQRPGVSAPDVVKIDVEGAEEDVLHGMADTLRRCAPKLILEVDDAEKAGCEKKWASCAAYLSGFGYRCEALPNSYRDGNWFVRHLVAQR